MNAIIWRLHVKPEAPGERGLPKVSTDAIDIVSAGVVGDFNRYRHEQLNDDSDQAILLMPLETLLVLNDEGWPVKPGDTGENITTKGIPYDAFAPGRKYRVGAAELEISKAAKPCRNLYLLPYVGEERGPEFLKALTGRRGWYARVRKEGRVRNGDVIEEIA